MRFKVIGRHSVKPPDGKRVQPGKTGNTDDQDWLHWASKSQQVEVYKPRPKPPEPEPVVDVTVPVSTDVDYDPREA